MNEHTTVSVGPEKSLTNWKNPPTLAELKQDFLESRQYHDARVSQIERWLDNLNVTGNARPKTPKGSSSAQPRLIRKQAEWRYSSLSEPFLSTEDIFKVSPTTWADVKAARQNHLVLNHQWNTRIDKVRFIDEYVRTAVDEGTVICRVGWCFEEEEVEVEVPIVEFVVDESFAPALQQAFEMQTSDPAGFRQLPEAMHQALQLSQERGLPIRPVVTGYRTEKQMRTVKNHPTVTVCDFRNIYIDPTCNGDLTKAQFVIESFESSLSALKKTGQYKNLDQINLDTNSILGEPDHASTDGTKTFNFSDEARKKFVVYEYWGYWDIDGTGFVKPIVAAWVGDVLIRLEENPFPDKAHPYVSTQYLPKRRDVYGEPDGALLEENQKIAGAVTRGMIDLLAKSANGQTAIRKDMLDVTNRRKFEAGLDYEFNANVDPRQGIFMHTYPEIPASAQFMLQLQNQEAEALTGVKAYSEGITSSSLGEVAAGIRGVLDASSKREMGILRRLSAGLIAIGRKIIAMNAAFLDEPEVVRITDEEFVEIKRDDLAGTFDLKLAISSAEEDNLKAQELAFMLQTMGNNMAPDMVFLIMAEIARLRKMPDLAKKIETYQPQPDPVAQRKAELELQLLEIELQEKLADIQLKQAKANTEMAKAENLESETDLMNLDFVEQESGVKQERDLQKQGAQAEAQARLKMIEGAIKARLQRGEN